MYEVNAVSLDYLTLTTFHPIAVAAFWAWHQDIEHGRKDAKRMQYSGVVAHHETGSAFFGSAEQRGQAHTMLQVSGLLAESAWNALQETVHKTQARVTRIDIQVTVPYDRATWSQSGVFEEIRLNAPNRSVSFVESKSAPDGGKLSTVYYGSRTSDRVTRLYEKVGMGEDVFLRFETEYKGARARKLGYELAKGLGNAKNVLAAELAAFPCQSVRLLFLDYIENPRPVKVQRESGNTKKWLLTQVLPALDRFLNDHNSTQHADDVGQAFFDLLLDHMLPGGPVD